MHNGDDGFVHAVKSFVIGIYTSSQTTIKYYFLSSKGSSVGSASMD